MLQRVNGVCKHLISLPQLIMTIKSIKGTFVLKHIQVLLYFFINRFILLNSFYCVWFTLVLCQKNDDLVFSMIGFLSSDQRVKTID